MKKILLMAAFAGFVAAPASANALKCLPHYYQGSNAALLTGYSKKAAKDNAVISWATRVTASVGPFYNDWKIARNKSMSCVKRGRLYKCTARAQACRSPNKKK